MKEVIRNFRIGINSLFAVSAKKGNIESNTVISREKSEKSLVHKIAQDVRDEFKTEAQGRLEPVVSSVLTVGPAAAVAAFDIDTGLSKEAAERIYNRYQAEIELNLSRVEKELSDAVGSAVSALFSSIELPTPDI